MCPTLHSESPTSRCRESNVTYRESNVTFGEPNSRSQDAVHVVRTQFTFRRYVTQVSGTLVATWQPPFGISRASIVESDEKLQERVTFIQQRYATDAIAEQYVDGREFYVGIVGNVRLEILPVWELLFENMPPGSVSIATAHVKHNTEYQRRRGIFQRHADDLPTPLRDHIIRTSRRIARILDLDGYNRIDYRLSPEGKLYFLEANPNPDIARSEEFASAAEVSGKPFPELIQRILVLGLQRAAGR